MLLQQWKMRQKERGGRMFNDIPALAAVCNVFITGVLLVLAIFCMLCLLKIIQGPGVADRLLAANMLGGIVNVMIVVLAFYLNESFLLDIVLVYALISFLAVVVLSQIYIGVFREKNAKIREEKEGKEDERA